MRSKTGIFFIENLFSYWIALTYLPGLAFPLPAKIPSKYLEVTELLISTVDRARMTLEKKRKIDIIKKSWTEVFGGKGAIPLPAEKARRNGRYHEGDCCGIQKLGDR
jgi:hypothetical protein